MFERFGVDVFPECDVAPAVAILVLIFVKVTEEL